MLGFFTPSKTPPSTVAAIDLGSNSFHMIVADISDGHIHVMDRLREMVRLAAGLDEQRNLSPEAQERALACLLRFGQRLQGMPLGSVRAVGTNTLRSAHNAQDFLQRAEDALGHPIEVIAGREEARLIYLGVAHGNAFTNEDQPLVIDIGGGSTEFIIGQGFNTQRRESLYMGCVSMSVKYFPNGEICARNLRKAEIAARLELQPIAAEYRELGWQRVLGASGSIKSIGKILQAEGWCNEGISLEGMRKLQQVLQNVAHIDQLKLQGLSEERRPILAGGFSVLMGAFEELGIQHLQVAETALREGLLYDLLGRIRHEDIRARTIDRMQTRYNIDAQQAQQVSDTAMLLLKQVAEDWQLDSEEHELLLSWAAHLHEIGLLIAHNQYHKHGEYLLMHCDLAGFSKQEQAFLACLVRNHRRKLTPESLASQPEETRQSLLRLSLLLRLSVLLHRNRNTPAPELQLQVTAQSLLLKFPPDWLAQHSLTQADLENEQNYLKNAGFSLEFE